MEIQLATMNDIATLAEMNYQLIQDEGHSNQMSVLQLRERMTSWLLADYTAVLVRNNSVVVGYVLWRIEEKYLYIRQFFIVPEQRRKGLGKKAIELLKDQYWRNKPLRLDVLVDNKRGRSFWQTVGFRDYCITLTCE